MRETAPEQGPLRQLAQERAAVGSERPHDDRRLEVLLELAERGERDAFAEAREAPPLRALGIARSSLYVMLTRGEIPSITLGKCRRIPASALERWVEEKAAQAAGEATR